MINNNVSSENTDSKKFSILKSDHLKKVKIKVKVKLTPHSKP